MKRRVAVDKPIQNSRNMNVGQNSGSFNERKRYSPLMNQDMTVEIISAKLMIEVNLISKKTIVRAIKKKI